MKDLTKKIIALTAAICIILPAASCKTKENSPEHVTVAPTETTPLTLTVSITEEKPFIPAPEEDEEKRIELAVYNPFSDAVKVNESVYMELQEAAAEIFDACAFLDGNFTGFSLESEYFDNYADTDTDLERNDELEYVFYPLNTYYAANEQELYNRIRNAFTEDYISDEKLREALFSPEPYDNQPIYKTIDGILCMKWQYRGVMTSPLNMDITVLSYDENEAEIVSYGTGAAYPPCHMFMALKKSDSGVWKLDKYDEKDYNENEAAFLYNAIALNTDTLNKILSGGTTPDNAEETEVNCNTYIETELDMTIEEMEEFFRDIFFTYNLEITYEEDEDHINGLLRNKYIREYIDSVYYEQDGKLFRKADAPRWYLPEIEIDPYAGGMKYVGGAMDLFDGSGEFFIWEQPFKDENGEIFTAEVTVCCKSIKNFGGYEFVRIGGELPIRELS